MISNLMKLGIHKNAIDKNISKAENLCNQYGHDISYLWLLADENLSEIQGLNNITNDIINAFFWNVKALIENYNDDVLIDYYVNCDDSHLYINRNKNALIEEIEEIYP